MGRTGCSDFLPAALFTRVELNQNTMEKDQVSMDTIRCLSQFSISQRTLVVCAQHCGQTIRHYILETTYFSFIQRLFLKIFFIGKKN